MAACPCGAAVRLSGSSGFGCRIKTALILAFAATLFLLFAGGLPGGAYAAEGDEDLSETSVLQPYAIYLQQDGSPTIRLYYDDRAGTRTTAEAIYVFDEVGDLRQMEGDVSWREACEKATEFVIDRSMGSYAFKSVRRMFADAKEARAYRGLSNLNLTECDNVFGMFEGNEKLEEIDVSGLSTSTVENFSHMFADCPNLKRVKGIGGWDMHSAQYLDYMFSGCASLETDATDLNIGSIGAWNVSSATTMYRMFEECSGEGFTSMDLRDWSTRSNVNMSYAFYNCSSLEKLVLGTSAAPIKASSLDAAFMGCTSLTEGDFSGIDVTNLETAQSAFSNFGADGFELDLSSWRTAPGIGTDFSAAFAGCEGLKSVVVGTKDNPVRVSNANGMFQDCEGLEKLDITGLDTSVSTNFAYMFARDEDEGPGKPFIAIGLEGLDVSSSTSFEGSFANAMVYTTDDLDGMLDLSFWDVSKATNFKEMFKRYSFNVDLTGWQVPTSADITGIFEASSMSAIYYVAGEGLSGVSKKGTKAAEGNANLVGTNASVTYANKDASGAYANASALRVPAKGVPGVFSVRQDSKLIYDVGGTAGVRAPQPVTGPSGTKLTIPSLPYAGSGFRWSTNADGTGRSYVPGAEIYLPVRTLTLYAQWDVRPPFAYATFDSDGVLTLRCDVDYDTASIGVDDQAFAIEPALSPAEIPWDNIRSRIKKVVVDESFGIVQPASLSYWFSQLSVCESIEGLGFIDTSEVLSADSAFAEDVAITSLDVSEWVVPKLKSAQMMFLGCTKLERILAKASANWGLNSAESRMMFYGCTSLVGYNGTASVIAGTNPLPYRDSRMDGTLARCSGTGGYFSDKAWKARSLELDSSAPEAELGLADYGVVPVGAAITLRDPVLDGASFGEWKPLSGSAAPSISHDAVSKTSSFVMPDADTQLSAQFVCKVTFASTQDADKVSWTGEREQTVAYGGTVEPPVVAREGYRFAGWFTDAALTRPWSPAALVVNNVNLYAKWAAVGDFDVTLSSDSALYDGALHKPEVTVKMGGARLEPSAYKVEWLRGDDYINLSDSSAFVDAGVYRAVVTGQGDYVGKISESTQFTIAKAKPDVAIQAKGWVYGDAPQTPVVTCEAGQDAVTLSYKPAKEPNTAYVDSLPDAAGTYTVRATVVETDNYTRRTVVADFTVSQRDINSEQIGREVLPLEYNGSEQAAEPVISLGDNQLVADVDYYAHATVEPKDVGRYELVAYAFGNYTGIASLAYRVQPASLGDGVTPEDSVEVNLGECVYDGSAQVPELSVTWRNGAGDAQKLEEGTDYVVVGSGGAQAGPASVAISGRGNFRQGFNVSYEVKRADIAKADISFDNASETFLITKDAAVSPNPELTVSYPGFDEPLAEGTDYLIHYVDDKGKSHDAIDAEGTWRITVEGQGNFEGSASVSPAIVVYFANIVRLSSSVEPVTLNNEAEILAVPGSKVTLANPALADALFARWRLDLPDDAKKLDISYDEESQTASFTMPDYNIWLVAEFACRITFVSDSDQTVWSDGEKGTERSVTLDYGTELDKDEIPGVELADKFFAGWFADAGKTVLWVADGPITSNAMVYAKWLGEDDLSIVLDKNDVVYTGERQRPEIKVYGLVKKNGRFELTELDGASYALALDYNHSGSGIDGADENSFKNAGVYTINAIGQGEFAGKRATAEYSILPAPLEGAVITLDTDTYSIDGLESIAPKPKSVVLEGFGKLKEGVDYTVRYRDADGELFDEITEAGVWSVVVVGKGNFAGTASADITVTGVPLPPSEQGGSDDSGEGDDPSGTGGNGSTGEGSGGDGGTGDSGSNGDGGTEGSNGNASDGSGGSGSAGGAGTDAGSAGAKGTQAASAQANLAAMSDPAVVSIKKLVGAKRSFSVKWAKQDGPVSGYQVRYSLKKSMKKAKVKTFSNPNAAKLVVKKLKKNKRYYVQLRSYQTYDQGTKYSAWSKKMSVLTKANVKIKQLAGIKGGFSIRWATSAKKMTGYQVRYSPKKSMKGAKIRTVKGAKKAKLVVKKLKKNKRYYVQVRSYKKTSQGVSFNPWSAKKKVAAR